MVVAAREAGGRLDVWLAAATGFSRSYIQRQLRAGQITVNGLPARAKYALVAGDRVELTEAAAAEQAPEPPSLPVIYEDADLLVIDKPAGLVVHGGAGLLPQPTVADFARGRVVDTDAERPGIVHRLDKDTSGLLVIAKHPAAKTWLQQQWRQRAVDKIYLLLAVGRVEPSAAEIRLPLGRATNRPTLRAVTPGGKIAVTRYRTLASYPGFSYIEAFPQTGRTHQLRVHFAAIGHPVAGDAQYGPPQRPLGLTRQFLHAAALSFTAPSGHQLQLVSPLPPELRAVLDKLNNLAT